MALNIRGYLKCMADLLIVMDNLQQALYTVWTAQQVLTSYYAQQVGPLYFCESSCSTAVGRGANSVVSIVHHHFKHHGYGEKNVSLHMDNYSGNNKKSVVIRMSSA
ncbi:uncharacterized protein LOC128547487 isoform X2 [Mercenaria mercenaria]|uniref:uncharacterized protein LOC128547487 isoform X2 n=1 Tax=Mercenaria mercenaria TaxID=6596 RepID=UPI00234F70B3|nr:uncharacterized protein LOC128547487 isoform X2 [Mercenaria mercenaria]